MIEKQDFPAQGQDGHNRPARPITVLVVEDEPLLLFEASDCLEDAGFFVHTAMNAAEALRILQEERDIDILFTDVQMPGEMNGIGLVEEVRDGWPQVKIMITSGHVSIGRQEIDGLEVRFFPKPYLTDRVVAEIGRMAARTDARSVKTPQEPGYP